MSWLAGATTQSSFTSSSSFPSLPRYLLTRPIRTHPIRSDREFGCLSAQSALDRSVRPQDSVLASRSKQEEGSWRGGGPRVLCIDRPTDRRPEETSALTHARTLSRAFSLSLSLPPFAFFIISCPCDTLGPRCQWKLKGTLPRDGAWCAITAAAARVPEKSNAAAARLYKSKEPVGRKYKTRRVL